MGESRPRVDERKLDVGMAAAYRAWQANAGLGPDASIAVTLMHTGDLAAIEALGFETHAVFGDQVLGQVRFRDVPALVVHEAVLWIATGRPSRQDLDTAVRDIRARASAPVTGAPVDGLWHAEVSSGTLTHAPKASGKGVIVAIMDTGIDFTHPMFIDKAGKTRILKIWDQTLTPASVAECPPVRLLGSNDTYGVEYDKAKIQAHLDGGATLAHRDCEGHGTHVAGIAAGGTNFTSVIGDAEIVGVAPEADIIAVKIPLGGPELKLHFQQSGGEVPWARQFADGVLYCLRSAKELGKPVVINMSFGDDASAGDGLDDDSRFIDAVLDPTKPPSDNNFPTGALIVKSAGNEGDAIGQMARITVPASGQIIVPLRLNDVHGTSTTTRSHCKTWRYKPSLPAYFWYRRPAAPLSVGFAVRSPHQAGFSANVMAGGNAGAGIKLELGIDARVGPPPQDTWVAFAPDIHRVTIEHKEIPPVAHPAGGTVRRQYVELAIEPKDRGGAISYLEGIWEVRITADPGTLVYIKTATKYWHAGGAVALHVSDKNRDNTPAHVDIKLSTDQSIFDPGGRHAITVAAYTDQPDDLDSLDSLDAQEITSFSSRGPLRDFSDPPLGPIAAKPDIAAPGHRINSAMSRHATELIQWPWWYWGRRFQEMSGTSMASPMVAGVIALMLEMKPTLNVTQVRTALSSAPRPPVSPNSPPDSTHAYGVGRVDAMTSHANT